MVSPVLVYNYLLYKEKGITDYYFSVLGGVGNENLYAGQEGNSWSLGGVISFVQSWFPVLLRTDTIIFLFGLGGIVLSFKRHKYLTWLLVLTIVFLVLYLAGKTGSSTHYVWIPIILSIFAGYAVVTLNEYISEHFHFKQVLLIVIIVSIITLSIMLHKTVTPEETSIAKALHDYTDQNIPKNAIVVFDPRIYRGIFAWSLYDWHYLEGTQFPELLKLSQQSPQAKQNMPFYYIECGAGTNCGWKPEDFQRIYNYSEQLSSVMHSQLQKVDQFKAVDTFIIYRGEFSAPLSVYEAIDRTHSFWYTPVGWKYTENAVDNYTPKTILDKLLNGFAFFILYADVLLALLSPLVVLYLLGKPSD